jgi:hypothetical protein
MGVDESRRAVARARHCLTGRYRRGVPGDTDDPPAADNDGPLIDHAAVADNDTNVRDHEVLGRRARNAAQGGQQSEKKGSFHGVILTPRPASVASAFRRTTPSG